MRRTPRDWLIEELKTVANIAWVSIMIRAEQAMSFSGILRLDG